MMNVNKSKLGSSFSSSGKSGVPMLSVILHSLLSFTVLVSFKLVSR